MINKIAYNFFHNKACKKLLIQNQIFRLNNLFSFNSKHKYFFSTTNNKNPKQSNKNFKILKNKQINQKKQISNINKIKPKQQVSLQQKNKQKNYKPILTQQQRNQLIFQQKLNNSYNELESLPSDSYDTVVQNFRRIKTKLMDRRVYIPNKPQILDKLDKDLQFVKEHHVIWRSPSTAPDRLRSDNKNQILQWELEQAKKKFYLSLLENQSALSLFALTIILIATAIQYYCFIKQEDKSRKIPKLFL